MNKSIEQVVGGSWVVGMVASSMSGLSSAFAGVYFENYVKVRRMHLARANVETWNVRL